MYKAVILSSQTVNSATNSTSTKLKYIETFAVQVDISSSSSPSGASVKLQASNDDSNWIDISGTSNNITADGNILINVTDAGYKYVRAAFAISSGSFVAVATITGKENR